MYRERLRSSTGCIRCKKRHQKCDEKRPRCSFCARHNVTCIWPTALQPQSNRGRRLQVIASHTPGKLGRQVARCEDVASLDPFHVMPVHHSQDIHTITGSLHNFFIGIAQNTLPFDVAATHQGLTRGWLTSVHADEAVCSSFVAYCAWFYSVRIMRESKPTGLSLNNEARSLALLRGRIERDEIVTEGTLLAAALHFFIGTLSTDSVSQLTRIAQGISALVTARGGPRATMRSASPSTRQSLIFADVFSSLLSAQRPFLRDIELPVKPPSYDSLFQGSVIDKEVVDCLGPELTDILKDLRFVLFFRVPSRQTRNLSSEESHYLFMLLQKISYGLCNQQSRFVNSRSLSEIAVYGMILVKEEVLLDIVQHPILPITILQRLRSIVSSYAIPLHGTSLTVVLWVSMMALVGLEFESERTWALMFITGTLINRYGSLWPRNWIAETRRELQQVLWHHRIEMAFTTTCAKICHLRSNIANQAIE